MSDPGQTLGGDLRPHRLRRRTLHRLRPRRPARARDRAAHRPRSRPRRRRRGRLGRTIFWLAVTGVSLYLVFPTIVEVLGSWRDITRFSLCSLLGDGRAAGWRRSPALWALQHVALRGPRWRPVITSQLAGNALAKVAPGGGAMGSALQYKMLVRSGAPPAATVTALTAVNLLVFAIVLAMPVLAIPALLRGGVERHAARHGVRRAGRVRRRRAGSARVLLTTDRPLAWVGRVASSASATACAARPSRCTTCRERLLRERDRILATLGPRWKRALLATVGRWTFDYLTLLAALAAIGSHPRAGPRPARVLRRAGARADPDHAGRARLRRGRPDRDARAGRRQRGRRACWRRSPTGCSRTGCRCRSGWSAFALAPATAVEAAAGRGRARRPRAGGRRRACGRC